MFLHRNDTSPLVGLYLYLLVRQNSEATFCFPTFLPQRSQWIPTAAFTLQLNVTWIRLFSPRCDPCLIRFWPHEQHKSHLTFLWEIQAILICGSRWDTYMSWVEATGVWTVLLYFIWLSPHRSETNITTLLWWKRNQAAWSCLQQVQLASSNFKYMHEAPPKWMEGRCKHYAVRDVLLSSLQSRMLFTH